MLPPADVSIRRDGVLFPPSVTCNGVGGFVLSSAAPLKKEIGMRRTLMLLFSTAAALLLASGAVLALASEVPDDPPMVDGASGLSST